MTGASISQFLTDDHRGCDEQFASLETLVQKKDWAGAGAAFTTADRRLRCHLDREEQVLFPAFEQATGMRSGPTAVMRMEHEQMRGLLGPLATAVRDRDGTRCLDLVESLLLLIQQHNMKEEQVLYPMCDQVVRDGPAMTAQLGRLQPDRG